MSGLQVRRCPGVELLPDAGRVLLKPFLPGDQHSGGNARVEAILHRVLGLSEADVETTWERAHLEFAGRHRDLEPTLEAHAATALAMVGVDPELSMTRRRLIGAYFSHEYSVEAAALANPSIVAGPDQSGLEPGETRFIMSLRAIGEGHVSSVEFRSGVLGPDLEVRRRAYSHMIATEPLPADVLAAVGLADRPTFADDRHMVIYGQRTADDRIAFGAPGIPYLFGSAISEANETHLPTHERIWDILVEMLPMLADVAVTHRWGGVLGIPRNWVPGLTFDRSTGSGVLGGYVGEGVVAANLAGRTMADLIVGDETDRTSLPWVGYTARRWEPEPLRYVGVRGSRVILNAADQREYRTDREASLAFRMSRLLRGGNR